MAKRWVQRPEGSNWGDFGEDDQRGRMNLVTPERRLAAAREVREGIAFPLSLPLDVPGGDGLTKGMRKPPKLFATQLDGHEVYCTAHGGDVSSDDGVVLYLQGSTQWDSFAHMGRMFDADGDGVAEKCFYNGFRAGADIIPPEAGGPCAQRLGIENLAESGAQGRGVLIDLTEIAGERPLAVGYDLLMRAIEAQRVEVRPGDFVLLNSGFDRQLLATADAPNLAALCAASAALDGSDARLLRWIDESGLVALCSDNLAVETLDRAWDEPGQETILPIHELCLFKLGIHLGELWHLADLADWLRAHERSAFLLTAPPLRLAGAVGSPTTPIATV